MRAMPRVLSASDAMKVKTPTPTSSVHSHLMSKEKICAAIEEPTSAPSITASAIGSAIRPRPAKEASRSAVAVELCRMPVTPMPARNALMRVRVRVAMMRRSVGAEGARHAGADHAHAPEQERDAAKKCGEKFGARTFRRIPSARRSESRPAD